MGSGNAVSVSAPQLTGKQPRLHLYIVAVVPLAVLALFWPAIGTFFAQDDFSFLVRADQATLRDLVGNFGQVGREFYRPLNEVYFAVLLRLFGFAPATFHAIGVLLLIVNAGLVGGLCRVLGLSPRASAMAILFYGCHSALLALAMWSAASNSLLAVFWSLLTAILFLRPARKSMLVLGLISYLFALSSREAALVLPPLLWLTFVLKDVPHDLASAGRSFAARSRNVSLLLLPAVGLYLILRWSGMTNLSDSTSYHMAIGTHLVRNAAALGGQATGLSPGSDQLLGAAAQAYRIVFVLFILLATVVLARRGKLLPLVGLTWFSIGILPVVPMTDHHMDGYYLDFALIGLALALASSAELLLRRVKSPGRAAALTFSLLAVYFGINLISVRSELPRSPIRGQAARAESLLGDVRRDCPDLSGDGVLQIAGTDEVTDWAMEFGDLFRAAYRSPALQVRLASRGAVIERDATVSCSLVFSDQHLVKLTRGN